MKILILVTLVSFCMIAQAELINLEGIRETFISRTMKEQEMISEGGPKSLKIPKFEIDLEEDPYTRWSEPTIYFKEQIIKLHETIISFVPWSIRSIFWMVTKYMEVFSPKTIGLGELNHQLFREFEGVSDITGIPLADVLTANFVYELFAH